MGVAKHNNKKTITKNYIYNMMYQILLLIIPLITTPFVSRVLGSSGVGSYSFVNSLTSYFYLLGALGFGYYAQREIARYHNDKFAQSKIFWEIQICKTISTTIALIIDVTLLLLGVYKDYSLLMTIMLVNVVSNFFDITFMYQGNEDFKIIVLNNSIFRIIGVVLIFIFVKNSNDIWKYVLCQMLTTIFANLSLWVYLPKYLVKINIRELNFKKHILPALKLFIPTIAISIYTSLDKTLIGVLISENKEVLIDGNIVIKKISDIENGYYEQAEKIVKMCMTIVTSLGMVMMPKNSYYFQSDEVEKVKENIYKALKFVAFLGTPIMFGIAGISFNFSNWFFGEGYEKVPYLIMVLSPLVILIGMNNVFGVQYLIPAGKDNIYTLSVVFGACINLLLNIILIPRFFSYGAAIATIVAEFSIVIFQYIYLWKIFSLKRIIKEGIKYLIAGILMFIVVFGIDYFFFSSAIQYTLLLILIGVFVYFVMLLIMKDKYLIEIINILLKKIKKDRE